jgi:hypothetical protein
LGKEKSLHPKAMQHTGERQNIEEITWQRRRQAETKEST